MILDRGDAADNADDRCLVFGPELPAESRSRRVVPAHGIDVDPQRDDDELRRPSDAERVANLMQLLLTQHENAIRVQPRKRFFDRQKKACFQPSVVAMKNVPVIRMDEPATPRPADQQRWR